MVSHHPARRAARILLWRKRTHPTHSLATKARDRPNKRDHDTTQAYASSSRYPHIRKLIEKRSLFFRVKGGRPDMCGWFVECREC